jgi:glycosyltransferase involved in cell wall biosynthesis
LRILYVNHTALVSGAERSLLALLPGLARSGVECVVACPEGELAERVRALGLPVIAIRELTVSWRLTPRTAPALVRMFSTAVQLRGLAHRVGASCIHANTVRAGLIALATRSLGGPPVVVHVRDQLPRGWLAWLTVRVLAKSDLLLAISYHVRRSLAPYADGRVVVVQNPVDVPRFAGARHEAPAVRRELGLSDDAPVLAVVGQITPWKAQDDAIRILARVREAGRRAHLLIVGAPKFLHRDVAFDNQAFADGLRDLAAVLGVGNAVHFLGQHEEIGRLLSAVDIVLVPSWQEPFGRIVVEAMASGTCVVATANGGPAEIVSDGYDGRLLPSRDPERWAAVVLELIDNPRARAGLGARGRIRAMDFAAGASIGRVVDCYRSLRNGSTGELFPAASVLQREDALDATTTRLGPSP